MQRTRRTILVASILCIILAAFAFTQLRSYVIASTISDGYAVQEPWVDKLEAYYYKVFKRASVYELLRRSYYFFGIHKQGVIHIGARYAEELEYYKAHGIKNVLWIEADPAAETSLKKAVSKHPGSKVAMFAAADSNGVIDLHRTSNDGHSSSILTPNLTDYYPHITETSVVQVPKRRLDDFLSKEEKRQYNTIVLDVQGAELVALKGAINTLNNIDAIIAELNYGELYKGSVSVKDLDAFLGKYGFARVDTISAAYHQGDALYIKDRFFQPATCAAHRRGR